MLIRSSVLAQIKSGDVTLAFRRWRKPTVKAGGTLKTPIGLLSIDDVEKMTLKQITATDAERAGFGSRQELLADLAQRKGQLFRITLAYAGADPRIELRKETDLSEADFRKLLIRLDRMDVRSATGHWTQRILAAIEQHPKFLAADLATDVGMDKVQFKTNVRKLKNLGLTISHQTGYALSPRGVTVLSRLREDAVVQARGASK